VKRTEAKSKGEKERCKHLNTEFQRRARRDKKAILSDHCKEIEENNRMGKTRDLFKKIRDTKGTFHAKIKDRNGMKNKILQSKKTSKETNGSTQNSMFIFIDVDNITPGQALKQTADVFRQYFFT